MKYLPSHILFSLIVMWTLFIQPSFADIRPSREAIMRMNSGLKTIVDGYRNEPLKQKAALFLIDNIAFHGSAKGKALNPTYRLYEIYSSNKQLSPTQVKDSVKRLYGNWNSDDYNIESDVKINVLLLKKNIDFAFHVWNECPWKTAISFNTFCEYVLPYRIGNEKLTYWRENVFHQYQSLFERLKHDPKAKDIKYAAQLVLDTLVSQPSRFTEEISTNIYPGPDIVKWRVGSCLDLTVMTAYVFRALGLPCTVDMMLMRGDNNVAHYWNATIDGTGKECFFSLLYTKHVLESPSTYWNPKGKVWRMTFSLNETMAKDFGIPQDKVHPSFSYPLMTDVTAHYAASQNWGIHIPRNKFIHSCADNELIYLCLSSRLNWVPVGYGHLRNDSLNINDAEGGVVYALATYDGERMHLLTDPFLLERKKNQIRFFSPNKEKQTITLLHKFNLFIEPFIIRMVNGVFEGSNQSDFSDADTLFTIKEKPVRLFNVCPLHTDKAFRYVRYIGPADGYCNVSEITFYASDQQNTLKGVAIGPKDGSTGDHSYYKAFDGDPYTSYTYDKPEGGWAGLDLGKAERIDKIVFTPRNRDNFIRKNDVYELFYMDSGIWNKIGTQQASSDSLTFDTPKNALLELKDLSRGIDERIFEYDNSKQVFW
jgi:hypothetical protein